MGCGRTPKTHDFYFARISLIEIGLTGAGSSLADSILEGLEGLEGLDDSYNLTLIDGLHVAGETRRLNQRTLPIVLDTQIDLSSFKFILDLNRTYKGDAKVFRPNLALEALSRRVFSELPADSVKFIHGSVREPAIIRQGGVEGLAAQVAQLFNGRDPSPSPFGGTIAFNARTISVSELEDVILKVPVFRSANVALERLQGDMFYTVVASLWLQAESNVLEQILALATDELSDSISIAPETGRNEFDSCIRVFTKALRNQWVYVLITADLERTIWAQDAVNLIRSWIEV